MEQCQIASMFSQWNNITSHHQLAKVNCGPSQVELIYEYVTYVVRVRSGSGKNHESILPDLGKEPVGVIKWPGWQLDSLISAQLVGLGLDTRERKNNTRQGNNFAAKRQRCSIAAQFTFTCVLLSSPSQPSMPGPFQPLFYKCNLFCFWRKEKRIRNPVQRRIGCFKYTCTTIEQMGLICKIWQPAFKMCVEM